MRRVQSLILVFVLVLAAYPVSQFHAATERQLTILHTNNTLNRVQEFKGFNQPIQGGAARMTAKVKELRAANPNSLLMSAGNDVMGTPMFAQYGGVVAAEVMSRIGYDVSLASQIDIMAGGSIDAFKAYKSVANYPLVNANMVLTNLPDVAVPPTVVLTVNGIKVGVLGLANERGVSLGNFGESITMRDTDAVINEALKQFAADGIDIVVVLSALGLARDKEVAEKYGGPQGIDLIIGSGNALLGEPTDFPQWEAKPIGPYPLVYNEKAEPTLVVYAHEFGSYLGELNLTFNEKGVLTKWGGKLHFLGEDVKPDPDVKKFVDELAAGIVMDKIVIGEATDEINGSYQEFSWQENPLVNMYADTFLQYGKPFGAQIALVNAGAAWASLPKGKVTVGDLYKVQPFFNWLIVMDITGEQLLAALENGVSGFGGEVRLSGRFLHVAGMTYSFDPAKPAGSRVVEVLVDGKPIDPKATYPIAVNDFMANGGDEFTMLRSGTNVFNTGISITDALQQYIEANSPVNAPSIGRIKNLGAKE